MKTKITKKHIPLYKGVDLTNRKIPFVLFESGIPGPTVWVMAAIHGDEVTGIEIVLRLMRFLKQDNLKIGKIYCVPILNPLGFEVINRYEPNESNDLNRCFPGKPDGDFGERVANRIYEKIVSSKPDLVIDLHTDTMESIPYIYLDHVPNPKDKSLVKKMLEYSNVSGINYFVENRNDSVMATKTISGSLVNIAKIPTFTIELGGPLLVKPKFVNTGLNSIKNILKHLKMIPQEGLNWEYQFKLPLEGLYEFVWSKYTPNSSGIVEYLVQPGDMVKSGSPIARIKNLYDQTVEYIKVREDCVIVSYADQNVCFPGTELFSCAVRNDDVYTV